MAYIGAFDELFVIVEPQIEAVIRASDVLSTSATFRKVYFFHFLICEIFLAQPPSAA